MLTKKPSKKNNKVMCFYNFGELSKICNIIMAFL